MTHILLDEKRQEQVLVFHPEGKGWTAIGHTAEELKNNLAKGYVVLEQYQQEVLQSRK